MREWFWQLQAAGQGPDWYFVAGFAPAGAERLAAHVRGYRLPDFDHYRVVDGLCTRHQHHATSDLYADRASYPRLVANLAGGRPQNIWIYHAIEVCGPSLTIERGYGGYPGLHGAAETGLIVALASLPEITLVDWQVSYGGEGYAPGQAMAGASGAELLAYLGAG